MNYPGHTIRRKETNKALVTALQKQLNSKGCGPIGVDGDFGDETFDAVMLFQTRFADVHGNPLTADGIIGPVTWASLFATVSAKITAAPSALLTEVLKVAGTQVGVMEKPLGSNSGTEVNMYQKSVGISAGDAWCMAFVYWCFNEAAKNLGVKNPAFKTGSVLTGWANAKGTKITAVQAQVETSLVQPGQVFVIKTSEAHGHTGFIESIEDGLLTTIEGNTNTNGSSNGIGVFRRSKRTINSINLGFIQF